MSFATIKVRTVFCQGMRSTNCAIFIGLVTCCAFVGCRELSTPLKATPSYQPASLEVRAARRAFDGAPPTIPHVRFGQACDTCHQENAKLIPTVGIAPANPHTTDPRQGTFTNCTQCHVFSESNDQFAQNGFEGLTGAKSPSLRAFPGAPPITPHSIGMRSNCLACHAGIAARPEILCSHPEQQNCTQCHVAIESSSSSASGLATLPY